MLKIICPDGMLEFPSDVLASSPYIKNTLLDKHFFGTMASKQFFLNFLFDEIKCLVVFSRKGVIATKDMELLSWINIDPKSALHIGLEMLKHGIINKYGFNIKYDPLSLDSITDYDAIYSKECLEKRRQILVSAIKTTLKKILLSSDRVLNYLLIEDKIINTIEYSRCSHLNYIGKEITDLIDIPNNMMHSYDKISKKDFEMDLDNMTIEWHGVHNTGVRNIYIQIPNRLKLGSCANKFSVDFNPGSNRKNNKITLESFICHVYRYNPLYNVLYCDTYKEIKQSDDESQFVEIIYKVLEQKIDACYEITS